MPGRLTDSKARIRCGLRGGKGAYLLRCAFSRQLGKPSALTRKSSCCPKTPAGFTAGKRCRAITVRNTYPSAQISKRVAAIIIFLSLRFSFSCRSPETFCVEILLFLQLWSAPLFCPSTNAASRTMRALALRVHAGPLGGSI